ncbi:MAG: hypothetical protein M3N98_04750 [Actinomycetota bacterium]|nr:hypothetical protein [Actinomycetota bacterium]
MADVPEVTPSSDPEAPPADALEQAMVVDDLTVSSPPSIDVEVPEADALEQAIPAYFDEEGDDRR